MKVAWTSTSRPRSVTCLRVFFAFFSFLWFCAFAHLVLLWCKRLTTFYPKLCLFSVSMTEFVFFCWVKGIFKVVLYISLICFPGLPCLIHWYICLLTMCEVSWLDIGQVPFFFVFMAEKESRYINSQEKRKRPISNYLHRTCLINKGFIIWFS